MYDSLHYKSRTDLNCLGLRGHAQKMGLDLLPVELLLCVVTKGNALQLLNTLYDVCSSLRYNSTALVSPTVVDRPLTCDVPSCNKPAQFAVYLKRRQQRRCALHAEGSTRLFDKQKAKLQHMALTSCEEGLSNIVHILETNKGLLLTDELALVALTKLHFNCFNLIVNRINTDRSVLVRWLFNHIYSDNLNSFHIVVYFYKMGIRLNQLDVLAAFRTSVRFAFLQRWSSDPKTYHANSARLGTSKDINWEVRLAICAANHRLVKWLLTHGATCDALCVDAFMISSSAKRRHGRIEEYVKVARLVLQSCVPDETSWSFACRFKTVMPVFKVALATNVIFAGSNANILRDYLCNKILMHDNADFLEHLGTTPGINVYERRCTLLEAAVHFQSFNCVTYLVDRAASCTKRVHEGFFNLQTLSGSHTKTLLRAGVVFETSDLQIIVGRCQKLENEVILGMARSPTYGKMFAKWLTHPQQAQVQERFLQLLRGRLK